MEAAHEEPVKPSRCRSILKAWDPVVNIKSLWERDGRAIPQLDGLRLAACVWVIAFHTAGIAVGKILQASSSPIEQLLIFYLFHTELWSTWWFRIFLAGDLGVDVFFVLSGFLIAYILYSEVDRYQTASNLPNGKITDYILCSRRGCGGIRYWRFLTRRWLRLMPAFLLAIPSALYNNEQWQPCKQWWWTNALLVNNFAGSGTFVLGCIAQSWSIAVEAQFYIISPLFIAWSAKSFWHKRESSIYYGWIMYALLLPLSLAIRWILVAVFDPDFTKYTKIDDLDSVSSDFPGVETAFVVLYTKTYARFGPYVLGMLLAYLYRYNLRAANRDIVDAQGGTKPAPIGCDRFCDGRRTFTGYLTAREAVCRPRLCCRCTSRPPRVKPLEESINDAEILPVAYDLSSPLLDLPEPPRQKPSKWRARLADAGFLVLLLAFLAAGVVISAFWPKYSFIISTFVEQETNTALRTVGIVCFRHLFALTTAAIILLCLMQRGSIIDAILSWKVWTPLARLTYSAYLLQFLPISIVGVESHVFNDLLNHSFVLAAVASWMSSVALVLLFTFGLALVMYLIAEKPAMNLRI